MEILKFTALILITLILTAGIPYSSKEITVIVTIFSCTVVSLYILENAVPAVEYISNMAKTVEFTDFDVVIKAVGVGFITQFVADMAADCNNKALSNQMILAGRISVLMLASPVFARIFEIIGHLIS